VSGHSVNITHLDRTSGMAVVPAAAVADRSWG